MTFMNTRSLKNKITHPTGLVLLLSCLAVAALAAPVWEGYMDLEDGLPMASKPVHPMVEDQTIVPQVAGRLGGDDDEQGAVFGLIGDAIVDEEGNSYILELMPGKIVVLGRDGRIVVFQKGQEYKLERFDPSGKPEMIIRREHEPVRRSDKAIEGDRKRMEEMRQRFGGQVDIPVREIARHISDAISRPNGDLRVRNSQGTKDCPEQSIGYFDVINQEGQYVKRVRLEVDYDSERDNFQIRDNNLFVFMEAQKAPERSSSSGGGGMMMVMIGGGADEEDEEPRPYEVICYRPP